MLYEGERLTPLVYVPAINTLFWENSCASGTAAIGAWLQKKQGGRIEASFSQPAGVLRVVADGETLVLQGSVRLEKVIDREL